MGKNFKVLVSKVRHGHNGSYNPWMYEAEIKGFSDERIEDTSFRTSRYTSLDDLARLLAGKFPELLLAVIPATESVRLWEQYVSISDKTLTQYGLMTDEEIGELSALIQKYYYLRDDAAAPYGNSKEQENFERNRSRI